MVEQAKIDKLKEKIAPKDSFISLQHINKIYSNHVQAVYDFNLEINEKEFIVFVGPSGCGKSTTLRMIAGLEDITSGDLYINGEYANDLEPKDRDVAMVFQSYALYPHMSVYDNLAFGLEVRKIPKAEIEQRIKKAAEILQISQYLDRKPKALSGGQCQRVALGRAIVRNAKVFLMDEPLSNLDAKLRVQMRSEIVNLHQELGATTIYVTHDQTEAMTMATRIVVMKDGYIQQIGSPKEVYDRPNNTFVATFIGSPAMNIIPAKFNNGNIIVNEDIIINLTENEMNKYNEFYNNDGIAEKDILLGIRPENIALADSFTTAKNKTNSTELEIKNAELLGNEYHLHFKLNEAEVISKVYFDRPIYSKEKVSIILDRDAIHLFDTETTKFIF
ncbi:MAG: sn-glycerol-3-phosphate ABC transporter ATP-binding protein UgpC [Acholeplasmatales bacterium]|nr:sn-glycerol-3-phosphate ABC transporter ATP-binding protein UgpC [Acholeplasmatales bacterium]